MSYLKEVLIKEGSTASSYLLEPVAYGTQSTYTNNVYTIAIDSRYTPIAGSTIQVRFANTNSANAQIKLNSGTAASLHYNGAAIAANTIKVNHIYTLLYHDSLWEIVGDIDTNTNTTYTFANGTNSFTVTPSGGTAQVVKVTPDITNNVTGTGVQNYLARFTENVHEIVNSGLSTDANHNLVVPGTIFFSNGTGNTGKAILAYNSGNTKYGIWYTEGEPDTLSISASGNSDAGANADFAIVGAKTGVTSQLYHLGHLIPHIDGNMVSVGTTNTPVYIENGAIKAGSQIKALGYKDSLVAADIPNLSWNKITSDKPAYVTRWPKWSEVTEKPTTIDGYAITDGIYYFNNHNNNINSLITKPYVQTAASAGGAWSGTMPTGSHNGVALLNFQTHSGNYYTQLALDTNQNKLWIRSANNSTTFGAWKEVLTAHQSLSAYAPLNSPALTGTPTAPTAANGTNTTQIATTAFVNNTLAYVNAMRFKGTIGTNGTVTALPAAHDAGDTYRVITAGTYAGKYCEVGTLIICVADGTADNNTHWTSVETNEDGSVIGPSGSTDNAVVRFDGATGRIIQNSVTILDDSGNFIFPATTSSGSTVDSAGLSWSGGTDSAKIFYRQTSNNAGSLVLYVADDGEEYINFMHSKGGAVYLKPNDRTFYPSADLSGSLGLSTNRWLNVYANALRLQGGASNPSASAGARIEFTYDDNTNRSQPVYISYTPNDSYRSPAGLKIFGGSGASPAWLEVEGGIYGNLIGNASTATTADKISNSTYYYNGNTVTNATAPETLFGTNARANFVFPTFMSAHPLWNDWADILNFTGYCKWGGTEFATQYNASYPRVAIRKMKQGGDQNAWGNWNEFVMTYNDQTINGVKTFNSTIVGDINSSWHILGGRPSNTTIFTTHFENAGNLHHDNPARTDVEVTYNRWFASHTDQTNYGPAKLQLPVVDQHILSFGIDNGAAYSRHLAFDIRTNAVYVRARINGSWGNWEQIVRNTGTWGISITGNAATASAVTWANVTSKPATVGSATSPVYWNGSGFTATMSFVRAYGTDNNDIDSDWAQSFKTFDPIPSGSPPAQNPNISTINIGENFNRRKQLAFLYNSNEMYLRRRVDGTWSGWSRFLHSGNYNSYAPTLTGGGASGTWNISVSGSAAKLTTARNLWGNSFDGSASIGGSLTPNGTRAQNIGTNTAMWNDAHIRGIATRHIDAATQSYLTDGQLHIGYGSVAPTKAIYLYYSADTSSRTKFFEVNSNGAYALTRFGVNGQNTSYNLSVNGTSYLNGATTVAGSLHIYGTTIGNTASNMISGTAGLFSWNDVGPKITFDTSATPGGSQAGAIIFTDHDTAGTGVSWHFVSNQGDNNVISRRFHARSSISIGSELPVTTYNLYVNGTSYFSKVSVLREGHYAHIVNAGSGTAGYFNFATITINAAYVNKCIKISYVGRGRTGGMMYIWVDNSSNSDPNLNVRYEGNPPIYYYKSAASTWQLYILKEENYGNDMFTVVNPGAMGDGGITITWQNTHVASLPASYSTSAVHTKDLHITGNAATASEWQTARTLTIGNTGKSVKGNANVSWSKTEIIGSGTTGQFLRGDHTWSNTLTGPLVISGTSGGPYLTVNYGSRYDTDSTLDNYGINLIKFGKSALDCYLGTGLNTNYHLTGKQSYVMHVGSSYSFSWVTSGWSEVMNLDNASRTLSVRGTGNYGGYLNLIGKFNTANLKLKDVDRPGITISGYYPQICMIAGGVDNASHGATIVLAGYDGATSTSGAFKAFAFGTPGQNVTWMDLGYGTSDNPHGNGINAYQGTRIMRWNSNGCTTAYGSFGVANTASNSGKGISLYNGATTGAPTYGIMFAGTATFGTHGAVTSDWATYLTMSDTSNRGWIFRRGSTNVASIDGTGKLYLGYPNSSANPGVYWNPYVESASDNSDVTAIYQIKAGVAGGTELRIQQANDSGDVINILSPYYIYFNSKRTFDIHDSWLRINESSGFSSGVYFGSGSGGVVRTDNQFQVGGNGGNFYANSSGNGYFSNTLGIAGTNTGYKLYVNGSTYFNSTSVNNTQGCLSFVQNNTIIGNTTNFNELVTPGCYKVQMSAWGAAATYHGPNEAQSGLYSYGLLFVFRGSTGDGEGRVEQIYFPHSTSVDHPIYCRMVNSNGWQAWHRLTRGSPTYNGGGASGTWGISITGNAATASRLTNITASDAASSTATQRYVFFSYDDRVTGRPAYDTAFTYQTNTKTLFAGVCLDLRGATNNTMSNATTNPRIRFSESGTQAVYLAYTDYDSYRASKGLKVVDADGSDASNVWFEVQGQCYAARFNGPLTGDVSGTATSAYYLLQSTRMDYGWNGINYFNISAARQSAAKVNDTPFTSATWTHILRFNHGNNAGYYTDLAIPFNANGIYYKRIANGALQNSGTNGGWVSVLDQLNYTTYTVTKTGGGASGTWGISISGNAATASNADTVDGEHSSAFLHLTGGTMTGNISFANSGTGFRGINYGTMGDNDQWRIGGAATASNAGYMEIATADDGAEPIYVRQYTGVFTTVARTLTLLDGSGNSSFPGMVVFNSRSNSTQNYTTAAVQVREYNYGGAQTDNWSTAPRLGFHWSGRNAAQIGLASNGYLYECPSTGTTFYRLVYESGTWGISISGNAATATALTSNAGDAYTPVYFTGGKPSSTTVAVKMGFTIANGQRGIQLNHAAFTGASIVTQIVVTAGEAYLPGQLTWESGANFIKVYSTAKVTGAVSGYIVVSRGAELGATSTANIS